MGTTVRYEVCPVGCRVWARRIYLHASVRVVPRVPTHNYVRAEVTATGVWYCIFSTASMETAHTTAAPSPSSALTTY